MKTPSRYLAEIGARGGSKGTGASKRRSPAHYARLARIRAEKREFARRVLSGELSTKGAGQ